MNYQKIYDDIMQRAHGRKIYDELHHILPTCLGGTDEKENLAPLTFKEHCLAHYLLTKIFPDSSEVMFAHKMMSRAGGGKMYGELREKYRKMMSTAVKEKWARKRRFENYSTQCEIIYNEFLDGSKAKNLSKKYNMSESCVWKSINHFAYANDTQKEIKLEIFRRKSAQSKITRANISEESEKRRIEALRAVDRTALNKKLSVERTGSGNPMYGKRFNAQKVQCPYCDKIGGHGPMMRWHFNNCRSKIET